MPPNMTLNTKRKGFFLGKGEVVERLTCPLLRGMIYVHNPSALLTVLPNLIQGARTNTV